MRTCLRKGTELAGPRSGSHISSRRVPGHQTGCVLGARAPKAGPHPVVRPRKWLWPGNGFGVRPWANEFKHGAAQPNGPASPGSRRCTEVSRWKRWVWEPAVFGGSVLLAGLTQPLPPPRWAVVLSPGFDLTSLLSPQMQSRGEKLSSVCL